MPPSPKYDIVKCPMCGEAAVFNGLEMCWCDFCKRWQRLDDEKKYQ